MNVPARTLHVTNAWHGSSGGARTFYDALLRQAADEGREMSLIVPGEQAETIPYSRTARIHVLPAPRSPFFDRRYRLLLPHRYLHVGSGPIWSIVARERPDVVEVSDKFSLVHLAGLLKTRAGSRPTTVGFSHERLDDALAAFVSDGRAARAWARWYLARIYMRQFDAHLANSTYTARELFDAVDRDGPRNWRLWRLRPRIHALPLGVDLDTFDPSRRSEDRRRLLLARAGGRPSSVLVVFAGRLAREKHVAWLIPAIATLAARGHDVRLVVAGAGPMTGELAGASGRQTPGRVLFLGHVGTRRELAEIVASADIFLHPNPREPFGIGPLEAMACGTPVVVPNAGGVVTYANGGNAWLAEPSPEGLADAAAAALAAPRETAARAAEAVLTARALSWRDVAHRLLETYDAIHAERLSRQAESTAGSGRFVARPEPFRSSR